MDNMNLATTDNVKDFNSRYDYREISEKKNNLINDRIKELENYIGALKDIQSGKAESKVCRDRDIDNRKFRHILYSTKMGYKESVRKEDEKVILFNGAERLYADIFHIDSIYDIPYDVDGTIRYILEDLKAVSDKTKFILYMYYYECQTLEEIGSFYNVSRERIRQIIAKGTRILRHPRYSKYFKYGVHYYNQIEEMRKKISASDRENELNRLTELLGKAEAQIKSLQDNKEQVCNLVEYFKLEEKDIGEAYKLTVDDLHLSVRSYNILKRYGVGNMSLAEISKKYTVRDLMNMRNMGRKSLDEIIAVFNEHGATFRE